MLELSEYIDIETHADRVWSLVGDFSDPRSWTPGLTSVDGSGNQAGTVRMLRFGDSEIREQLVEHDSDGMLLTYRWLSGALPVSDYVSTLRVEELTPRLTRVTWSARCTPQGVTASQLERILRNAYRRGLMYLAGVLTPTGGTARGGAVFSP